MKKRIQDKELAKIMQKVAEESKIPNEELNQQVSSHINKLNQ